MRRWTALLTAALVLGALVLAGRALSQFSLRQALDSLQRLSPRDLALSALFTAGSYLCLTLFDYMGVRYAGHRLPWRKVALASFVSLALGHTIGLAPLSSGAVRYRFYSQLGLDPPAVAKIVLFSALSVGLGELSLAAGALLADPQLAARVLHIAPAGARALGAGCAALLAAYVAAAMLVRGTLRIRRVALALPSRRLALAQIAVGCANYALVAAALRFCIAPSGDPSYPAVATAYVLANLAALVSHVPGGLGVMEAVIVTLFPRPGVLGGLIAYRAIYFLIPFTAAAAILIVREGRSAMRRATAPRTATDGAP